MTTTTVATRCRHGGGGCCGHAAAEAAANDDDDVVVPSREKQVWGRLPRLSRFEELPDYLRDNEFIRAHYRCEMPANNTSSLARYTLPVIGGRNRHELARWPRTVSIYGVMTCMFVSAAAHLMASHSCSYSRLFWQLDYVGIAIMMVSCYFPPIYYLFLGSTAAQIAYLSAITFLGVLVVIALLAPDRSSPRFRHIRAGLFACIGLFGFMPALHALWLNWGHQECYLALSLVLAMGLVDAVGAGCYVARVPERWRPGAFDCVGHNHQIYLPPASARRRVDALCSHCDHHRLVRGHGCRHQRSVGFGLTWVECDRLYVHITLIHVRRCFFRLEACIRCRWSSL